MRRLLMLPLLLLSPIICASTFEVDFVRSAIERTTFSVVYDGAYHAIPYPNGDVPDNVGVCTDVVIRAYRKLGTDLQVLVHEDMAAHFSDYPSRRIWGLGKTDRNIDHRRVPNLRVFFSRHGAVLPLTNRPEDYKPGDLVTWMLPGNLPHIGIVSDRFSEDKAEPLIVHNIGRGPQLEDMLFNYKITGHYKYVPHKYKAPVNVLSSPVAPIRAADTPSHE